MSDRKTVEPIVIPDLLGKYNVICKSHVGCVREENQDFMGQAVAGDRLLVIVADGMGGHSGGYEASRIAVGSAIEHFQTNHLEKDPKALLYGCVNAANNNVYQAAQENPMSQGMGTTMVVALVENGSAWLAHVGDSRIYLYRNEKLSLLTLDHSRVNRMVEHGLIRLEEADNHPMSNILERSVGHDPHLQIDIKEEALELGKGDRLILCSDGYWGMVKDQQIRQHFQTQDLDSAVTQAIQTALDYGADDNTTIGVIEYQSGQEKTTLPADSREGLQRLSDEFHQVKPTPKSRRRELVVESHSAIKSNGRKQGSQKIILLAIVCIAAIAGAAVWFMKDSEEETGITEESIATEETPQATDPAVTEDAEQATAEVAVDSATNKDTVSAEDRKKQNAKRAANTKRQNAIKAKRSTNPSKIKQKALTPAERRARAKENREKRKKAAALRAKQIEKKIQQTKKVAPLKDIPKVK